MNMKKVASATYGIACYGAFLVLFCILFVFAKASLFQNLWILHRKLISLPPF